jgi:hypothetical protein
MAQAKKTILEYRPGPLIAMRSYHRGRTSRALFEDATYISFSVQNGDYLKGNSLRSVNNGVIRITGQRPRNEANGL